MIKRPTPVVDPPIGSLFGNYSTHDGYCVRIHWGSHRKDIIGLIKIWVKV